MCSLRLKLRIHVQIKGFFYPAPFSLWFFPCTVLLPGHLLLVLWLERQSFSLPVFLCTSHVHLEVKHQRKESVRLLASAPSLEHVWVRAKRVLKGSILKGPFFLDFWPKKEGFHWNFFCPGPLNSSRIQDTLASKPGDTKERKGWGAGGLGVHTRN